MKPPTTLMVAKIMAVTPRICVINPPSVPLTINAPTIVIPEIALAPDIRGVCKVGGTFDINSNPMKQASTNIKRSIINGISVMVFELGIQELGTSELFLILNSVILN